MKFKVGDKVAFRRISNSFDIINDTGVVIVPDYLTTHRGIIVLVESDTCPDIFRFLENELRYKYKTILVL